MAAQNWGEVGDFDPATVDSNGFFKDPDTEIRFIGIPDMERRNFAGSPLMDLIPEIVIQCSTGIEFTVLFLRDKNEGRRR